MMRYMDWARAATALCGLLSCVACGDRPEVWDTPFSPGFSADPKPDDPPRGLQVASLTGSMAVLDPSLNEVLMLTSPRPLTLEVNRHGVGRKVAQFKTSRAADRLFVLSRGVTPRYKDTDEPPQLRVFDGGTEPKELAKYELQDPYEQLEIDSLGEWLIVHGSDGLVSNPNELILIKPAEDDEVRPPKALDSQGGKPVKFKFTSAAALLGDCSSFSASAISPSSTWKT
jgi:hypothetical protein